MFKVPHNCYLDGVGSPHAHPVCLFCQVNSTERDKFGMLPQGETAQYSRVPHKAVWPPKQVNPPSKSSNNNYVGATEKLKGSEQFTRLFMDATNCSAEAVCLSLDHHYHERSKLGTGS